MDDYMMMEYLRGKEMKDEDFVNKFKHFMKKENMRRYSKMNEMEYPQYRMHMHYPEEYMRFKGIRGHENQFVTPWYNMEQMDDYMSSDHFDSKNAKEIVAEMYHIENGRKYVGEKFTLAKVKELMQVHKSILPESVTEEDLYVAVNAQYHDYCKLFKSWFGSDIDKKIIESAIVFWFKDPDYKGESKIVEYFMMN